MDGARADGRGAGDADTDSSEPETTAETGRGGARAATKAEALPAGRITHYMEEGHAREVHLVSASQYHEARRGRTRDRRAAPRGRAVPQRWPLDAGRGVRGSRVGQRPQEPAEAGRGVEPLQAHEGEADRRQ